MADEKTVRDLIDYYSNLLIIQYTGKPKAQATIRAIANAMMMDAVFLEVENGYSVETSIGKQLDVIGKYVGVSRYVYSYDLEGYFSLIDYDEVSSPPPEFIGAADYSDFLTKEGRTLIYPDVITSGFNLTDTDYRTLIKLAIIRNNSNHSHASIDEGIYKIFSDSLIADSLGNMAMNYFVNLGVRGVVSYAYAQGLLPKPIGVRINSLIYSSHPFFGFTTYDGGSNRILGFSDYSNYDTKDGNFLKYSAIEQQ